MNVPSIPRASSFDEYIVRIRDCRSDKDIVFAARGASSGMMGFFGKRLLEFVAQLLRGVVVGLALEQLVETRTGCLFLAGGGLGARQLHFDVERVGFQLQGDHPFFDRLVELLQPGVTTSE